MLVSQVIIVFQTIREHSGLSLDELADKINELHRDVPAAKYMIHGNSKYSTLPSRIEELNCVYKEDGLFYYDDNKKPYCHDPLLNTFVESFLIGQRERAKNTKGFKFIHVLAPCPTGWKADPRFTIKLAKLAVQTNSFPIYEVVDGIHYKQNIKVKERKPLKEYFKFQGRFKHLHEDEVQYLQDLVDENYELFTMKLE